MVVVDVMVCHPHHNRNWIGIGTGTGIDERMLVLMAIETTPDDVRRDEKTIHTDKEGRYDTV